MKKLRVLSLFSGIGAFEKALENLGIDHEVVNYCEIDKYASKAYSLIHNIPESMNLGDIRNINENDLPEDIDLLTYGFPCQDISIAGEQKGFIDVNGNKTRSGLFFDALRIIRAVKPKVAIAENVKNLTGKTMQPLFYMVKTSLAMNGYNNYWKILNAKDYGIPQNRERVFIVSIRQDIDDGTFQFPEPIPLTKCLKDMLETEVDSSYDISAEGVDFMYRQVGGGSNRTHWDFGYHNDTKNQVAHCITATYMKGIPHNVLVER